MQLQQDIGPLGRVPGRVRSMRGQGKNCAMEGLEPVIASSSSVSPIQMLRQRSTLDRFGCYLAALDEREGKYDGRPGVFFAVDFNCPVV